MKIDACIKSDRGIGSPMSESLRLVNAADDAELEELSAFARCLSAAARVERDRRTKPKRRSKMMEIRP